MALLSSVQGAAAIDPNTKSGAASAKLDEDLNRFLNLLVTQLKNQDPLDPMDASEFTSQLVQFASVEQQIYQNANLEKMLNLQQTSQVADMVSYLGTTIESKGDTLNMENGTADFSYSLDSNADNVTVSIRNSNGLAIATLEGATKTGEHKMTWDGMNSSGTQQPDGVYTIIVSAKDRAGDLQDVSQSVFGRVTGAGAEDGKVTLSMGDVEVDMNDVIAVKETTVKN